MKTIVLRYSETLRNNNIMNIAFTNNKQQAYPNEDFGYKKIQVHKHRS